MQIVEVQNLGDYRFDRTSDGTSTGAAKTITVEQGSYLIEGLAQASKSQGGEYQGWAWNGYIDITVDNGATWQRICTFNPLGGVAGGSLGFGFNVVKPVIIKDGARFNVRVHIEGMNGGTTSMSYSSIKLYMLSLSTQ